MKSLIACLALVVFPVSVYANSACDNPKNDFDGLYCLNKIYLQADKDLNETFGKLRKQLDAQGKEVLKQGQLAWIDSRNNQCSFRDGRGFFVNLECATSTTVKRVQFLEDRLRECLSSGCQNSKLK